MRQLSSSISSFEWPALLQPQIGRRKFRYRFFATILSMIMSLVALDIVIGFAFRPPDDPLAIPTTLQAYFDYGRSVEGKLRRMVGVDDAHDAPIVEAGWLARDCTRSTSIPRGKLGIDVYGNSFSQAIAEQMERLDPGLAFTHFGGPGAPPNHSYACFVQRNESGHAAAPVQIIGVLAGTLRRMLTIGGLTTSFEQPQPFAYPRFTISSDGHLVPHWASIQSPDELRSALADRIKWRAFLDELSQLDAFYAPEIVSANFADHSVLLRLIRRAWGQRVLRERTASLHLESGFSAAPEIALVLRAILVDFAERARAFDQRPIVILMEDRGNGGLLSDMLRATLEQDHIEFIATGKIIQADDPHNFVPDGHFTSAAFSEIARAMLRLMNRTP